MNRVIVVFIILTSVSFAFASDSLKTELWKQQLTAEMKKEMDDAFKEIKSDVEKQVQIAKDDLKADYKNTMITLGVINLLLIGIGISIILQQRKAAVEKLKKQIDEALYRVNPLSMPIKIPVQGMEYELERLKKLKFRYISTYKYLDDSCTRDAVILLCHDNESALNAKKFILDKDLKDSENTIFIVYAKGPKIDQKIFGDFVNVTYANNPLTLIQALFVASRGMVS